MEPTNPRQLADHLANERTFLAWIRTAIGIMAFGFVVVKFSLFVKQLSLILGSPVAAPSPGYSSAIGVLLVGAGTLTTLLAFLRYRGVTRQINQHQYRKSSLLVYLLTGFILLISIILIWYLTKSV
ncbi:DUF202 domain-containing protein [Niabella terrae]